MPEADQSISFLKCGACRVVRRWLHASSDLTAMYATGLFAPGQIPAPAAELFTKNAETWETHHFEGAAVLDEQ